MKLEMSLPIKECPEIFVLILREKIEDKKNNNLITSFLVCESRSLHLRAEGIPLIYK